MSHVLTPVHVHAYKLGFKIWICQTFNLLFLPTLYSWCLHNISDLSVQMKTCYGLDTFCTCEVKWLLNFHVHVVVKRDTCLKIRTCLILLHTCCKIFSLMFCTIYHVHAMYNVRTWCKPHNRLELPLRKVTIIAKTRIGVI